MDELCLFTGLGKRKRVMDEKELMMPLELGYVQVENNVSFFGGELIKSVIYQVSDCHLRYFFYFLKTQVAERNENQNGGGAAAGRGGLLCPLWQETEAVPRCNEGTAALQRCSLVDMHDTEAAALMLANEQWTFLGYGGICFEKRHLKFVMDRYLFTFKLQHCSFTLLKPVLLCYFDDLFIILPLLPQSPLNPTPSQPTLQLVTLIVGEDIPRFTTSLTFPSHPNFDC